jgi:hypothetical protein
MICDKCGKSVDYGKYDKDAGDWKCEMCFYGVVEGAEPIPSDVGIGWEPHEIKYFMAKDLPKNWPGREYVDGQWRVMPQSPEHEKATMKALDLHWGEKGEKINKAGELEFKARPKLGNVVYSFMGKNRKASSCR